MGLKEYEKTIRMCRFCWMCRHACPTFLYTKNDAHTPRGYGLEFSMILDNLREFESLNIERTYQCSQCGLCRELCVTHFPEDDMIRGAREEIVNTGKAPQRVRDIANSIINKGTPYEDEVKKWNVPTDIVGKNHPDVLYFAGCSTRQNHPEIIESISKIFKISNTDWAMLQNENCCGMSLFDLGYTEEAKKVAQKLADTISDINPNILITGCAHCYRSFKEKFPEWDIKLPSDLQILHTTKFYEHLISKGKLILNQMTDKPSVSYHDPCQLGRKMCEFDSPRKLIEKITGELPTELFHNREKAECCGAGAVMFLTEPELSKGISKMRLERAKEEQVEILVTACQNCKTVFVNANENQKNSIKILDIAEFIALQI